MENHSLIERIKSKDGEAELKEIYDRYHDEFLVWVMRNHSCTVDEAKDVFQQTVISLYENIVYGKVKEIRVQVKTYLFGIAKNKIYELLRQKESTMIGIDDKDDTIFDIFYSDLDEEYEEKLNKVEACLAKLGDPCKSILEQYYYHNKSMQEISEILEYKNRDTVKNLKYKCIRRLKHIFNSDFDTLNKQPI